MLLIFLQVDFDNWKKLFDLDVVLPEGTFVWGFHGPVNPLKSKHSPMLLRLISKSCFYLHPQCGSSKDAADFALCCTVSCFNDSQDNVNRFTKNLAD